MTNSNDTDGIEVQYTRHPYPAPISNMRERIQLGINKDLPPIKSGTSYSPRKPIKMI